MNRRKFITSTIAATASLGLGSVVFSAFSESTFKKSKTAKKTGIFRFHSLFGTPKKKNVNFFFFFDLLPISFFFAVQRAAARERFSSFWTLICFFCDMAHSVGNGAMSLNTMSHCGPWLRLDVPERFKVQVDDNILKTSIHYTHIFENEPKMAKLAHF